MSATEFRQIDPRSIMIGTNVRASADLDDAFIASVRDLGVLTPVTVNANDDGTYLLRYGQRRTLAALQAELDTIPALVLPTGDDTDETKASRLVEQWAENEHRTAISDSDRVNAVEQLALLSVPAKQIASRLQIKASQVTAAKRIAASPTARAKLDAEDLTIEDAAIWAKFDGDDEALAQLARESRYGGLRHAAQRIRDQRKEAKARAAFIEQAQGTVRIVDEADVTRLWNLHQSADVAEPIDEEAHTSCPGHAAFVSTKYGYDENDNYVRSYVLVHGCVDPIEHGHMYRRTEEAPKVVDGKMTEEAKAERRAVIANNKAHEAAVAVRAEWIAKFAKASGPLKGVEQFIALTLINGDHQPKWGTARRVELVGKVSERSKPATALRAAASVILQQWHEDHDKKDEWRRPSTTSQRILTAMESWGYQIAPVERLVMGEATEPEDQEDESPGTE